MCRFKSCPGHHGGKISNSTESFTPFSESIHKFFLGAEGIFVIPEYQRQYSWANEELDDLWNDFLDAYRAKNRHDYFLGSVVIVANGRKLSVVDGQQRITTLMIMLNVLYKTFPDLDSKKDEDDLDYVNSQTLKNMIYYNGEDKSKLQLQTRREYDSVFRREVINRKSFDKIEPVLKSSLKKENPVFKFRNTAKFFYDKFTEFVKEYGEAELADFVRYIVDNVYIIKIVCYSEPFAIKLFLILNDRGKDLTSADIIKTYILDKYDKDEDGKGVFEKNWHSIEETCSENDIKMDEFLMFYNYYKLDSFPQKQITDDFSDIIKENEADVLVQELSDFENGMKEIFDANTKSKDEMSLVYSLRYVPWTTHAMTAMSTAYMVKYPDIIDLFDTLRRFYYLNWMAGKTLNAIKQTSFNMIKKIREKAPLTDIQKMANTFLKEKSIIRDVYEALDDDIYGESFLRPLLFSIEYRIRDDVNKTFYVNNKDVHVDHIIPWQFDKKPEEWPGLDDKAMKEYLNKLGNMALCSAVKNLEALNYGMDNKIAIYQGKDKYKSGYVPFDTTRKVVDEYLSNKPNTEKIRDDDDYITKYYQDMINSRKDYLKNEIEEMLSIHQEND